MSTKNVIAKMMRFKKGIPHPDRGAKKYTGLLEPSNNHKMWDEIYLLINQTLKDKGHGDY
jgi:hypothetical protein